MSGPSRRYSNEQPAFTDWLITLLHFGIEARLAVKMGKYSAEGTGFRQIAEICQCGWLPKRDFSLPKIELHASLFVYIEEMRSEERADAVSP